MKSAFYLREFVFTFYQRHRPFLLLLLLFVSFRLLALLLFRPGGFITDFSDYDFYRSWGLLAPAGYHPNRNVFTDYPPLFPALGLAIFRWSAVAPPWVDPRLAFHTLLGVVFLLFETGNFVLIYRLSQKLGSERVTDRASVAPGESTATASSPLSPSPNLPFTQSPNLHAPLFYTLLFTPVYTLVGWFETLPLFFLLLGLDLLLVPRRAAKVASAGAVALGILAKLVPALLLPVAVRWLGARLSWQALRREWFRLGQRGSLLPATGYVLLVLLGLVLVGWPLVQDAPQMALISLRVQNARPPQHTLWGLVDGYASFGYIPVDRRNIAGLDGVAWESNLPNGAIALAFLALFLFLYTRPYNWRSPRTAVTFTASSLLLLFLYNKGWSPQWLVWVLAFLVLLLPTGRGVVIAVALMLLSFVESHVYLILLPGQTWLLWGAVLARTGLFALLLLEFLGQIWPRAITAGRMRQASRWGSAGLIAGLLLLSPFAAVRAGRAYADARLAAHPCQQAVTFLQAQAPWPTDTILSAQSAVWEQFHPWLGQAYDLRLIDSYRPGEDPAAVTEERLAAVGAQVGQFWWLEMAGEDLTSLGGSAGLVAVPGQTDGYFARPDVQVIEEQQLGLCRLRRVVQVPTEPLARAAVAGGPILLLAADYAWAGSAPADGTNQSDRRLHLVLYWQALAPVEASYTVFTQLFDETGALIAQQDNLPVEGLAPTHLWQPGTVIRDPYVLTVPAAVAAKDATTDRASLRLLVGLYNSDGRRALSQPDGTTADFYELSIPLRN